MYCSDPPMIPFRSLFHKLFIILHLLVIWERNTIYPLQRVIFLIPQKIRRRVLCDFQRLDLGGVWYMWAKT